jgi:hypothetical protein
VEALVVVVDVLVEVEVEVEPVVPPPCPAPPVPLLDDDVSVNRISGKLHAVSPAPSTHTQAPRFIRTSP